MVGRRILVAAVAVLVGLDSFAQQTNPPAPPDGFEWHECKGARLSILKPKDWHLRERLQGGTYGCSVSKENVDKFGPFRTGLMVNFMTDVGRKSGAIPSEFAATWVRGLGETQEQVGTTTHIAMTVPDYGPIQKFECRVRAKIQDEFIFQHYVLFADDKADRVHLMYFEGPEDEWEDAWKIGKIVLDTVQVQFTESADDHLTTKDPTDRKSSEDAGDTMVVIADDVAQLKAEKVVVTTVGRGMHLKVRKVSGDWFLVSWEGKQGWINRRDVRPLPQAVEYFTAALRSQISFEDLVNRGNALQALGDHDSAIRDFDQAIQMNPKSAPAWYSRGNSWRMQRESEKALGDYSEAIRLNPQYASAYNNRGVLWSSKDEEDKAIADFTLAIRIRPNDASTYLNRASSWSNTGQHDKAISDYTQVIRIHPDDAAAYLSRAVSWSETGQHDKAITDFTQSIRLDPGSSEAYLLRGDCWRLTGEQDRAVVDFSEAIRLDPNAALAYYGRAMIWRERGDHTKAIADLSNAIRIKPKFAVAFTYRGDMWSEAGDNGKAIADYTEAIRLDPNSKWAYNGRGHRWRFQGKFEKAIADYTQVIRVEPDFAPAYNNRGVSHLNSGERQEAMADFNETIRLDPKNASAYRNRGALSAMGGDIEKAISDFTEAIRYDPNDAMSYYNRAQCWNSQHRYEEAIGDFKQATKLDSTALVAFSRLAWIQATCPDSLYRNGQEAIQNARKACDLTQWSDASYLDTLAAAYAESGDFENAVKWQEKAIAMEPKNDDMRSRLSLYQSDRPYHQKSKT